MARLLPGNTPAEKLLLNMIVVETGCWRWQGAHIPQGYGQLQVNKRRRRVHVLAHELWIGPVPEGHDVDHVRARGCRYRDCINPTHLEAVTHLENMRRSVGGVVPRPGERLTHCKQGHEFTPENTYVAPSGDRSCRTCRRNGKRAYVARRREAA